MILVDTNVLVYAVNIDAREHHASRALLKAVSDGEVGAALVSQILLEFFAVVTNPRRVERPLTAAAAWGEIDRFRVIFRVLDPGPSALDELSRLMKARKITGPDVFDAWLVAQMRSCGVSAICTYNAADFAALSVTALTPEQVLGR